MDGIASIEMSKISEKLNAKKAKDIRILSDFIAVFCRQKHREHKKTAFLIKDATLQHRLGSKEAILCRDCHKLLHHGIAKLLLCPYDPKPACKKCQTHCYTPSYRGKIRQVMKFSGMHLIKRGRLDLIIQYFR